MTSEERIKRFVDMYARPKSELSSSSRIIRESAEIQRTQMTAGLHALIDEARWEIERKVTKRFETIINGKGLVIPRIACKKALDDLFAPRDEAQPPRRRERWRRVMHKNSRIDMKQT